MKAAGSPETSVPIYQAVRHCISEYRSFNIYRNDNLGTDLTYTVDIQIWYSAKIVVRMCRLRKIVTDETKQICNVSIWVTWLATFIPNLLSK